MHASVALILASVASPLHPLAYEDSSSASDVSLSIWHTSSATVTLYTIGGGVPPTPTVPQGTVAIPLAAMECGVPPHVPVPMGGAVPCPMGGGVPAPV